MWKYNCQKANKMFVLIKFIIMFAVRLEPLKKDRQMKKNISLIKYYRIGKSEGCLSPVPTDSDTVFSFKKSYS